MIYKHHLKMDSYCTTATFWNNLGKTMVKENPPIEQNFGLCPCCSLYLEGEMAKYAIKYQFVGCGQWVSWKVGELERI